MSDTSNGKFSLAGEGAKAPSFPAKRRAAPGEWQRAHRGVTLTFKAHRYFLECSLERIRRSQAREKP